RLIDCAQCGAIREGGKPCFCCGFLPQRPPRAAVIGDGELGLVEGGKIKFGVDDPIVRAQWLDMLTHIPDERGYQRGWIAHKYREKFRMWPPRNAVAHATPPSAEVRSWVRSRMIAFAKRRNIA